MLRTWPLLIHGLRLSNFLGMQRSLKLRGFLGIYCLRSVLYFFIELVPLLLQLATFDPEPVYLVSSLMTCFLADLLLDFSIFLVSWAFPVSSAFPMLTRDYMREFGPLFLTVTLGVGLSSVFNK